MMLEGKVAVVTGGSRGLGEAIAIKLASMGADIAVICSSDVSSAEGVCSKCRDEYKVRVKAYRCDVSDFNEVKETVAQIEEMQEFGTVELSIFTDSQVLITRIAISAKSNVLIVNIPYIFICMHISEYH